MTEHRLSDLERRTRRDDAISEVIAERRRQLTKWGEQDHSPSEWMMILMEEVGEFAQAEMDHRHRGAPAKNIKEELVQVAAVALAMLEDCNRNDWGKEK